MDHDLVDLFHHLLLVLVLVPSLLLIGFCYRPAWWSALKRHYAGE